MVYFLIDQMVKVKFIVTKRFVRGEVLSGKGNVLLGVRTDMDGGHSDGSLHDIRIYDRALNAPETGSLYHEGGYMNIITVLTQAAGE